MKASISTGVVRRLRAALPSPAAAVAGAHGGLIGSLMLAAAAALAQATPSTPPPAPTTAALRAALGVRYDQARDEYEVGHFQSAFAEFAVLADAGHCGAARMALQMLHNGKTLYAAEFHAAAERVQRWQHLPSCVALARR